MNVKWNLQKLRTMARVAMVVTPLCTLTVTPSKHVNAVDNATMLEHYIRLEAMQKRDLFEQREEAKNIIRRGQLYNLEQERSEKEEAEQLRLEEQRRLEEEQRRLEEERQKQRELERQQAIAVANTGTPRFATDGSTNLAFRQTVYDVVQEGGIQVSHGEYWNSPNMRVNNNLVQYYDREYGWVQVVALNIDQVKEYGTVVTSTMLGSIIEMTYPNGEVKNAIVLDVCGAARTSRKIDLWIYDFGNAKSNTNTGDIHGVEFKFVRFGM